MAAGVWGGERGLPGEWVADAGVADVKSAYLMARPKVFGLDALLVRALHRGESLEELQITFADAGSFFGYLDLSAPEGVSREEGLEVLRQRVADRQVEFAELYGERLKELEASLLKIDGRPSKEKRGRSRDLRAELKEYESKKEGVVVRLLAAPDRLLRVSVSKKGSEPSTWLDRSQEELGERGRLREFEAKVVKTERGDVMIPGVEVVPQGYRPYCGLNTLTMVARYLGLHLDEDWLAVAGKFQNTGSAAGSDMLGLYDAVAREAQLSMERSREYDHGEVRRSVQAGMPVIVWRRWDQGRDRLHTEVSRDFAEGEEVVFEKLAEAGLPSKEKRSPLHASVIIGFNDARKEVIFLESWEGRGAPRRMPVSEMAFTSDFAFCFQP